MVLPAGVRPAVRGSLAWQLVHAGVSALPPANDLRWKASPRAAENPVKAGSALFAAAA